MRQTKDSWIGRRGPGWDLGMTASVFAGVVNLVLQSLVLLGEASELALALYSAVVFLAAAILLLLGKRTASFTIYSVALLTSYSDVSWTGSGLEEHACSVADLRLGPLSIAMWYLLLVGALILIRRDLWRKGACCTHYAVFREMRPLGAIVLLGILGGAIRLAFSDYSFNDLTVDLFSMAFVFLFLYAVLGCLSQERVKWLLKTALRLAVASVAINVLLGARVDYGGQPFVPIPDIVNYLPIVAIAIYGARRGFCVLFWLVYVAAVFGAALIAPTGKLILVLSMSAVYLAIVNRQGRFSMKRLIFVLLSLVALLSFSDGIADFLDGAGYQVLAYKYRQVFTVGKMAMDKPELFYASSIGNLAAEMNTVWTSATPADKMIGRGFGAWYKDETGYLTIADPMAYTDEINRSGRFRRFHLPIIQVASWTGLVGVVFYAVMVGKLWKRIGSGDASALLPLTILLFTLGFLKENQLMFSLGLVFAMRQAKATARDPSAARKRATVGHRWLSLPPGPVLGSRASPAFGLRSIAT